MRCNSLREQCNFEKKVGKRITAQEKLQGSGTEAEGVKLMNLEQVT